MKQFAEFFKEVNTYDTSGSGAEKKFFKQFTRGGETVEDHDTDPANWTEAGVPKSVTAINANAVDGDKATPSVPADVVITDELPIKKYNGPGSKTTVSEDQHDVRDAYRDEISTLLGDISDLTETLQTINGDLFTARGIADDLRRVRDVVLGALNADPADSSKSEAVSVKEDITSGSLRLLDGKTVIIEQEDADILNTMFEGMSVKSADKLKNVMENSKEDFVNTLEYAKALNKSE